MHRLLEIFGCACLQVTSGTPAEIWVADEYTAVVACPGLRLLVRRVASHVADTNELADTINSKWARRTRLWQRCKTDFEGFDDGFSSDLGEGRPPRSMDLGLMKLLVVIWWMEVLPSSGGGGEKFRRRYVSAGLYRCFPATVVAFCSGA